MENAVPATVVSPFPGDFLALVFYTAVATLLIAILLLAAWWLGSKSRSANKDIPYESGVIPTDTARLAYPVPFYLVAIFLKTVPAITIRSASRGVPRSTSAPKRATS